MIRDYMGEIVIVSIVILLLAALGWSMYADYQWHKWAKTHCDVIGKMSSSTGVGPSMSGQGGVAVVVIPGKTGYQCDDGQQYWR